MKNLIACTFVVAAALLAETALAADVDARLSAREAYVGMPITLQITISDASDYQQPTLPRIDGCDIRSAGTPSQSSQITIINGRRSESRSVTLQYLITPRREGTFEIPSLKIEADGKTTTTQPQRFIATRSVTGDLLFVEIEGGKDQVFVGQPLDLTLNIWIKPYRDADRRKTLSEGDMWRMISEQTSWGSFAARMKELDENNQRPSGSEVLRDDGQGNERSYYLYEIEATVYPKRPGKIDAEDVQIVVNYPTALGKSRSPFGSFFEDSPFGGSSPLSRMMNDDFFGSSPFGSRLTVTDTRPIVGEVSVDATEVLPVPSEGRPDDYRGAVGRYRIVTQATPTTVDAGDPITLNIGIAGTGPMELVQAPPLSELSSLTADFKVADQSLAGFVRDDTKVFSTTIRPRREGITEIPPIRFSFFDPDTQAYQTVVSDPIVITVNQSESLALDAIVGKARASGDRKDAEPPAGVGLLPDFTNNHATSVLMSQSPTTQNQWWWIFVVAPPIVWLGTWFVCRRNAIAGRLPSLKSARKRCLTAIERANDGGTIAAALRQYIARRSGKPCATTATAMGALRAAGMYEIAQEVESYLQGLPDSFHGKPELLGSDKNSLRLAVQRETAIALMEKLETAYRTTKKSSVRLPRGRNRKVAVHGAAQRSLGMLIAVAIALSASNVMASQGIILSTSQQQTILDEAGQAYAQAIAMAQADSADAKELFQTSAGKYQLLVDSGIHNSELYKNLGNAYLQSGELGRAIANYERARQLDPSNRRLLANLHFANTRVEGQPAAAKNVAPISLKSLTQRLRTANASFVRLVGGGAVIWMLVIASLVFWGLLIAHTAGRRFPLWRWAAAPLAVLVVSLTSVILIETDSATKLDAVIVVSETSLHVGDGEQFDEVVSVDAAQGHRVEVLGQRGMWTQVRTTDGHTGWVRNKDIERFDLSSGV